MNRRKYRFFGSVVLCAASVCPAVGAEQCLHGPANIPSLTTGPEWTDFDGDGFWRPELHDPRWGGSTPKMLTFTPDSKGPLLESPASVRALVVDDVLYVAAYVDDDSNGPTLADSFQLGLTEGTGDKGHVFQISMACNTLTPIAAPPVAPGPSSSATPADPDPPRTLDSTVVKHWHTSNARAADPTWTQEPAGSSPGWESWMKGACWDRSTSASPRWAVTLRISLPKTDDQDRELFFGVVMSSGGSPNTITPLGNVAPAKESRVGSSVGSTLVPKSAANWEHYTTDHSSPQSPCRHALTLERSDLGVWVGQAGNPEGGLLVDKICSGDSCGSGDNIFRITAKHTSQLYAPWEVRARFRISDWGSTPDTREFGTWQDVWALADGTHLNPLNVDEASLIADPRWHFRATPTQVQIDFECLRGDDGYCPKLQSGINNQQAFLVEVARAIPGGQPVKVASALRNMRYEDLSVTDEQAAISVAGLEEVFENKDAREVYLHVITRNLPAHDSKPQWLKTKAMDFARWASEQTFIFEQHVPSPSQGGDPSPGRSASVETTRNGDGVLGARAKVAAAHARSVAALALDNTPLVRGIEKHEVLAMTDDQLLDAVWPTYRVRPYYVKERTVGAEGEERTTLVPMPAFGLRLTHDGPLYGFNYTLKDENNKVMAPTNGTSSWYKMTIPNEGRRNVRLGVVAEEEPKIAAEQTVVLAATPQQQGIGRDGCASRCGVQAYDSTPWPTLGALLSIGIAQVFRARRRAATHRA